MNFRKDFVATLNLFLDYLPKPPKQRYRYTADEAATHRFIHRRKPRIVKVAVRRQHRLDRNRAYPDLSRCCRDRECARRRRQMARIAARIQ